MWAVILVGIMFGGGLIVAAGISYYDQWQERKK